MPNPNKLPLCQLPKEERDQIVDASFQGNVEIWDNLREKYVLPYTDSPLYHRGIYRVKPKEEEIPMAIPWEVINPMWKFAAKDASGEVSLFISKPKLVKNSDFWWPALKNSHQEEAQLVINDILVFDIGTVSVENSLIERPKTNIKQGMTMDPLATSVGVIVAALLFILTVVVGIFALVTMFS